MRLGDNWRRTPQPRDAYGPEDPVEDNDLVFCRCGVEKPRTSTYCWSCGR